MKRAQRRFHASIWPVIGLVMIATVAFAFVAREHPAQKSIAPAVEPR